MSNNLYMTREQVLKIIRENKKEPIPVTYPVKVEYYPSYGYSRFRNKIPSRDTLIIIFDVFNKKQIARFISVGRSGYYHNEALDIMCVREEIYKLSNNDFYRLYDGKDIVGEDFEYRVEKEHSLGNSQLGIKTNTEVKFEIKELTENFQSLKYSIKKFENLVEEIKEKRFSCDEAQFLFSPSQVLKFVTNQFYEIFANEKNKNYFIHDINNHLLGLSKDYQRPWLIAEKNGEFKVKNLEDKENNLDLYYDLMGIASEKLVCGGTNSTLQIWSDYIHDLIELGEDIHNPKLLCPEDIEEAHRETGRRIRNIRQKKELEETLKRAEKFNSSYIKNHKKWLDIVWETEDLIARPLQNIQEFYEEGNHMCHCVFRCEYYKKAKSLILSIRDKKTNKRLETAEVDMIQEKILQCYGYGDQFTDQHDNIIKFINKNLKNYAKENRDNESCRKLQEVKKEVK